MTALLTDIVRYPVKGMPGIALPRTTLTPGSGLPLDRVCAIGNSTLPMHPDSNGWIESRAFLRLAQNEELARYRTELDDRTHTLRILSPAGEEIELRLQADGRPLSAELASANARLQNWFPAGPLGPVRLEQSGTALWDWPHAALSLINLDTVDELSRAAGVRVDPRRFRANLYVRGLGPWRELDLVGRRIRMGGSELAVVQATDRCGATAVDPRTGQRNLNIPALLAAQFGHLYCGVYAQVVRRGTIAPGDTLTDLGPLADPSSIPHAASDRPRHAVLTGRTTESPMVTTLHLTVPAGPAFGPGQHLRLHTTDAQGPLWRCYTVTGSEASEIRVSVKRVAGGRMSSLLHELTLGTRLLLSGPYGGEPARVSAGRPVLFAVAGIGITPVLPRLRQLADTVPQRQVTVLNVVRTPDETPLWNETIDLLAHMPHATHHLYVTTPGAPLPVGSRSGRPTADDIGKLTADGTAEVFVCGPDGFTRQTRAALLAAGVEEGAITDELFFSPRATAHLRRTPPAPGPFEVRFTGNDIRAKWTPDAGTLLDLAESAGLRPPTACRAGACGTCRRPVVGEVAYLIEPVVLPPSGQALLCCSVPTSDVEIHV
ncbi:MOSC domain-containing protein [Streptomyces albipurpureus]|uniref:MOSC domain-containing protein n=1 Tax=Streptomyces albipurpureus TaxID=2897419 RepID=A0ABT0UIU6_9ACTN|nr:MOSC domain-containing protein [Streptomyces sp. CWNU-1]MCM2388365.1 MOSC domain-containing protein [Streptomyces sp. CWNU-1]